ncbi:hypothetical protein K439DRAFT_49674 [Ramaria rubella]|nr:hypothetical protein K439DRAFT_49674 [Ramaria rubella]
MTYVVPGILQEIRPMWQYIIAAVLWSASGLYAANRRKLECRTWSAATISLTYRSSLLQRATYDHGQASYRIESIIRRPRRG